MNKYKAALEGSKEIYFAVISTSITWRRFFADYFSSGFVGACSANFGIVVPARCWYPALCRLTLTPVLSVKTYPRQREEVVFYNFTEPFFTGMENVYQKNARFVHACTVVAFSDHRCLYCFCVFYWNQHSV